VIPKWFLYLGGFSLVMLGILQVQARPREPDDSLYRRFVNLGTLWSLICMSMGLALLFIALGYWQGPLPSERPPARPHVKRHY
jgi:hypothetical protein